MSIGRAFYVGEVVFHKSKPEQLMVIIYSSVGTSERIRCRWLTPDNRTIVDEFYPFELLHNEAKNPVS